MLGQNSNLIGGTGTSMKIIPNGLLHNQYAPSQVLNFGLSHHEMMVVSKLPVVHETFSVIKNDAFRTAITAAEIPIMLTSGSYMSYALAEEYYEFIGRVHKALALTSDGAFMAGAFHIVNNAKVTYEILREYERRGLRLIPVIDANVTSAEYVDYYVNNYPTVIVSAMGAISQTSLEAFFDKHLLDGAGKPKCALHGTNITEQAIRTLPWASADTSIWIDRAKAGQIISPLHGPITVDHKHSSVHSAGRNFINLSEIEKASISDYLGMNGFLTTDIVEKRGTRAVFNLWALGEIENQINNNPPTQTTTYAMELF